MLDNIEAYINYNKYDSVRAILGKDEIGAVFLETIKELDKKTQKLLLFQFKLDIESKFTGYFTKEEWKVMRYDNIQDHTKLTLQGHCTDCGLYPFQLDVFEFLKLPFIFTMRSDTRGGFQKIDCTKCGKPDSLEILPIWYQSDDNRVIYLSFSYPILWLLITSTFSRRNFLGYIIVVIRLSRKYLKLWQTLYI